MKRLIIVCLSLMATAWAFAQTSKDDVFGSGVDMSLLVPIDLLLSEPHKYLDQSVTVEGKVVSVCDKKGCWMMLASGDHRLRIKVNDGEMVFPFNAKDKTAFATGKLEALKMSKERAIAYLSHLAEDAGESFDPATVTGETTIYQLRPTGVVIKQ
jgi:hypothetical protein